MARQPFYQEELRLAGALDVGRPVQTSTLTNVVFKLFNTWDKDDGSTRSLLLPSIRLASHLVSVGMPYISSFLPSQDKDFWSEDGGDTPPNPIPLNLNPTQEDIDLAHNDLDLELPMYLKWRTNDTMKSRWGHLGSTRLKDTSESYETLDFDTIHASDMRLKYRGRKRRPLVIAIMKEFVTAIKDSDPTSEPHLRATFMAAITMAHEVGHAIFHNDFRSFNRIREPYVGDGCEAELGSSFVSWIFSGFHPLSIPSDLEFKDTLFWEPQDTLSMGQRPLYKKCYSIPISYLERMMTQEFWDSFGAPSKLCFSERARKELRPSIAGQGIRVATSKEPNWTYSHLLRRPLWKEENHYRMPGFQERNRVKGLYIGEIEREREQTEDDLEYATMSKEERHQRYRLLRSRNAMYIPDEGDIDFWGEPPDPKPTIAKSRPLTHNWRNSQSGGRIPSLKRPESESTSTKIPLKRPRLEEIEEERDYNTTTVESQRYLTTPMPAKQKPRVPQETGLNSAIETRSSEIADLVKDLIDLVYEPAPPHKRRMLGSQILGEIEDFEEIMGVAKESGGEGTTNARPRDPPSHMQDIYEQIQADDDEK